MKTRSLALSLVGLLALVAASSQAAQTGFKLIHVPDLVQAMQQGHPVVCDANKADVRSQWGVIPGAKLLSSSSSYDVAKELPADKGADLVFYCANTRCMASHGAASRAVKAGYIHVSVLADGIQGWAKAGQKTAKP
ncbi:MAG TPA: rhodanese-like domain-containing protein [Myxococcales bacterium]|nr:rhodanese-like domain-containing protein [Myxococcales bacterium]